MAIRHSITLSTSEPNNEVGNLKIRQGDEQTQTLVANITENGVPKPFVGLQPFFCAKLGQTAGLGIIEQKVTGPMNPANGTLEYVMQPEDWQQLGRQTAYFSFRKMVNDHEWTEQFSTRDFNYNVTKSAFSEGLREVKKDGSTYIWTIEDMLRLFKEYMATGKNEWKNYKDDEKATWEKFVEDNREFLENADPGGKIILELLGGRGGFDSLGERLDGTDKKIEQSNIYVYLESYPRMPGETDDTNRLKRAISEVNPGQTLYGRFVEGGYTINDSISILKKINVIIDADVVYAGPKDRSVIEVKSANYQKISVRGIYDFDAYPIGGNVNSWNNEDYIGLDLINCKDCEISVDVISGFAKGNRNKATDGAGHWYNVIDIKRIINCKILQEINSDGLGSWINGNIFRGTTYGYSSMSPLLGDTSEKYSILQTLTNGNLYGGNSNVFENVKFEVGSTSPDNWDQLKLVLAIGWEFRDYRYERSKSMTNNKNNFAVIDLSSQNSLVDYVTHSRDIIFKPKYIIGSGHEITFKNTKDLQLSYSEIAKIDSIPKKEIYAKNNLIDKYRIVKPNYHIIKGTSFLGFSATTSDDETLRFYKTGSAKNTFGVEIPASSAIVFYIQNVKKGDEFTVTVKSARETETVIGIKPLKSDNSVFYKDGINKTLAFRGRWQDASNIYSPYAPSNYSTFTVNSDNVNTLAVLIYGVIENIKISGSNDRIISSSVNSDRSNLDRYYNSEKPTSGYEGFWQVGEIVHNANQATGQVVMWSLKNDFSWESSGLRN